MIAENLTRWQHQTRMVANIVRYLDGGGQALAVTAPTGAGKSVVIFDLVQWAREKSRRVLVMTNRRMLLGQLSRGMGGIGMEHGLLAAGYEPDHDADVQIAMTQTVTSKVYERAEWERFPADLVIVDEAHQATHDEARRQINDYREHGAEIVGFTATPVGLRAVYERLYIGANKAELFAQGILVKAATYSPDEPDMKTATKNAKGEWSQQEIVKRIMVGKVKEKDGSETAVYRPRIFGRVLENYRLLNPTSRPAVLFAPGVAESLWFARELQKEGITTAHIDAQTPDEDRERIREASKAGDIEIVCNRFVMRTGVDWPWLCHGIFATATNQYSTWCQMVGRLLRCYPGKTACCVQDHGGNYHRFWEWGSPNADYPWTLEGDDKEISERVNKGRQSLEHKEREPICCPQCTCCRLGGPVCPHCGYRCDKSVRNVVQHNGKLKKVEENTGEVGLEERRVKARKRAWMGAVFAAWHAGLTFKQAHGIYSRKIKALTGDWPPGAERHWPMPEGHPNAPDASIDWTRKVAAVHPDLGRKKVQA